MNIFSNSDLSHQNMVIYTLYIDCYKSHLRTFLIKSTRVTELGGMGGEANFGNAKILKVPHPEIPSSLSGKFSTIGNNS